MAIYQFHLVAIPREGIIKFLGEKPNKIEVGKERRTDFFLNNEKGDKLDDFENLQHKCWSIAEVNSNKIINEIDNKLERASWGNDETSNNWKTETNEIDNDAWISTTKKSNQIEEFAFRVDLRQPKLKFLMEMIVLAKENDLIFIDGKGNLIEAEFDEILEFIKESNAYKFVESPTKFLNGLEQGEIEIE